MPGLGSLGVESRADTGPQHFKSQATYGRVGAARQPQGVVVGPQPPAKMDQVLVVPLIGLHAPGAGEVNDDQGHEDRGHQILQHPKIQD
eukprot:4442305-Alexandrium_andersonii.AAC.1